MGATCVHRRIPSRFKHHSFSIFLVSFLATIFYSAIQFTSFRQLKGGIEKHGSFCPWFTWHSITAHFSPVASSLVQSVWLVEDWWTRKKAEMITLVQLLEWKWYTCVDWGHEKPDHWLVGSDEQKLFSSLCWFIAWRGNFENRNTERRPVESLVNMVKSEEREMRWPWLVREQVKKE